MWENPVESDVFEAIVWESIDPQRYKKEAALKGAASNYFK